jgi:hypothetical protein
MFAAAAKTALLISNNKCIFAKKGDAEIRHHPFIINCRKVLSPIKKKSAATIRLA